MSSNRDGFDIGIICALPLEARAVKAMLEEVNEEIGYGADNGGTGKTPADTNTYTIGKIGHHKVVLVHMSGMGKIPAAAAATNLKQSFGSIKLALLVGICGGAPGKGAESIMLGDVVVGKQVVHYDFGREHENGFQRKDNPEDRPSKQNSEIQSFIRKLEAGKGALEEKTYEHLAAMLESLSPEQIDDLQDNLYPPDCWHIHQNHKYCDGQRCKNCEEICDSALKSSCEELKCDQDALIRRGERKQKPNIHFGWVASGDKVIKSAAVRDKIAEKEGIIAFDMEAAGVWDYLPCILIKGVSDYADSHKNGRWQEYAAIAAAACAKAILEQWDRADKQHQQYQVVSMTLSSLNRGY
ncbi:hypothetical protein TWF481_002562 [Arthrobotrys musiformis]|uniref:Nucleoside phosphorylase domain-containing protein n=1 Tax=Arthrobotrys musiformis TaxID=47236 RepID=A0AAV9VS99_9PEZI